MLLSQLVADGQMRGATIVSILVVMDVALAAIKKVSNNNKERIVSILVVMDVALAGKQTMTATRSS